ncbi:glycosyltransferase [Azospirillum sp. BE72]|uniref:glycosyltransferase family 2 protein n=1 Tax=Azospirillum sp. BE72 TaxID=2817776 RepID=UPI002856CCDE|nr:glycosyltransferase [Azospirillum sp. BE72]MDR6774057.1 glycosyltransferase involved in cell wall biosynthesis [Azospirillum sp. BE72]
MMEASSRIGLRITTYNRASYLNDFFARNEAILSSPNVNVRVFDNHSTDETENIVWNQVYKRSNLSYYRWPENVGFDRSLALAIEKEDSSSDYLWWCADDDIIAHDALDMVQKIIREINPDVIFINYSAYNVLESGVLELIAQPQYKVACNGPYGTMSNLANFFRSILPVVPSFGCFVIKRSLVDFIDTKSHIGTHHAYIGFVLNALARKAREVSPARIGVTHDPLFYINKNEGTKTWSGKNDHVIAGVRRLLSEFYPEYNEAVREVWPEYEKFYFNYAFGDRREFLEELRSAERFFFE